MKRHATVTPQASIETDLASDSNRLFIFFGGIAGNLAMPPFEFYNSSGVLADNKVFVRDLDQCWYHGSGNHEFQGIHGLRDRLNAIIDDVAPTNLAFVGNSMGGFAAILFACLHGEGRAIAIAPQTFLSPHLKLMHFDLRWKRQTLKVWREGLRGGTRFWDLRPIVERVQDGVLIDLYVASDNVLDQVHARHLELCSNVSIHEVTGADHQIVTKLRDQGKLCDIVAGL